MMTQLNIVTKKDLEIKDKDFIKLVLKYNKPNTEVFVNTDENHYKFWSYEMDEENVNINWGKMGTKTRSQIKNFSTIWEATNFVHTKIREKIRKGYKRLQF